MKYLAPLFALLFAVPSYGCPVGTVDFRSGCAEVRETIAQPSNEKPPRSGRPSWEEPGIKVDMPPTVAGKDADADLAKEHELNVQQTEAMEGKPR